MARSFFRHLQLERTAAAVSNDLAKAEVIEWIEEWMRTSNFSSYRKAGIVLANYTASVSELALLLGIREASAKGVKLDLNKDLFDRFGRDFFDLLNDQSPAGRARLAARIESIKQGPGTRTLLRPDLLQAVNRSLPIDSVSDGQVELGDCVDEIHFLRSQSVAALDAGLQELSPVRLAYLIRLLDGEVGHYVDRERLAALLREAPERV